MSNSAKNELKNKAKTYITTTMIGAIEAVEKGFGFLWAGDSEDAKFMQKRFVEVRKSILDKGNKQIKSIDSDINEYEVDTMRFVTNFPVIQQERTRI